MSEIIHDTIAKKNGMTPMRFSFDCNHDYKNPIRKGRAHYVCRNCGQDITLALVYIQQLEMEDNND